MLDDADDWTNTWASASLRIASEELTPDEISEFVGVRPTSARVSEGSPSFCVWLFESTLDSRSDVADHLYVLVEQLRSRVDEMRVLVARANVEIWLTWSFPARAGSRVDDIGPSVLSAEVLGTLAEMGIDLVIEAFREGR